MNPIVALVASRRLASRDCDRSGGWSAVIKATSVVLWLAAFAVVVAVPARAGAQDPNVLRVTVAKPRDGAIAATASAFVANNLTVDRADQTTVVAVPITVNCCSITYRATVLPRGDSTDVLLSATWQPLQVGRAAPAPKVLDRRPGKEPWAKVDAIADSLRAQK